MGIKPAWGQQELPFALQRKQVLRKLRTTTSHVKHLLRVLDDHIGNHESWECWLAVETIAEEMCCSERTARRAIFDANRDGWIIVSRPRRRKGRNCNTYRLRRAEMWDAVGVVMPFADLESESEPKNRTANMAAQLDESSGQVGRSTGNRTANLAVQHAELNGQVGRSTSPHIRNEASKEEGEAINQTKPPPAKTRADWLEVEAALVKFPVGDFRNAISSAKSHGCPASHVLDLIAYADTNRALWKDPSAALWHRVVNAHPDQTVADGWPKSKHVAAVRESGEKYWHKWSEQ